MKTVGAAKKTLIAYCRVSTDQQGDDGYSLDAQQSSIAAYCALYGYSVTETIVEVMSGKTVDERDGLKQALARLPETSGIIVYSLSRLSRSLRDLTTLVEEHFRSQGKVLISVSENISLDTAAGELMLNLLGSFNQYERSLVSERTKLALSALKKQGKGIGRCPYGKKYASSGKLVDNLDEMAVIRKVKRLREKNVSYALIAENLTKEGIVQRNGKPFSPSAVYNTILK